MKHHFPMKEAAVAIHVSVMNQLVLPVAIGI